MLIDQLNLVELRVRDHDRIVRGLEATQLVERSRSDATRREQLGELVHAQRRAASHVLGCNPLAIGAVWWA